MEKVEATTKELLLDALKRKGYDIQELENGEYHINHKDNDILFNIIEQLGRVVLKDIEWYDVDAHNADDVDYVRGMVNLYNVSGNWKLVLDEYEDVITVSSYVTFFLNEEIANIDDYVINQLDTLLNCHSAFFGDADKLIFMLPTLASNNVSTKIRNIITDMGKITDSSSIDNRESVYFRYEGADMAIRLLGNRPFAEVTYKELYVIPSEYTDIRKDAIEIVEEINRRYYLTSLYYYGEHEGQDLIISIRDWLYIGSDRDKTVSVLFGMFSFFFDVKRMFEKEMLRRSIVFFPSES